MKTAVCISGRLAYLKNHENIREHVINPYRADVFIDTWIPFSQSSAQWSPSAEDWEKIRLYGDMPDIEDPNVQEFINLFQPKLINMEHFDLMPLTHQVRSVLPRGTRTADGGDSPGTKRENVMFMWYKIWKCNQLRKLYESINRIRYDVVIRMRFDTSFDSFPVIEPTRKTIYIPQGGDHGGGICDQVAIADSVAMDMYCELWNEVYRYNTAGVTVHPESLLRKHLEVNKLNVERFPAGLKLRGQPQ